MELTKLALITGEVYTELSADEVRNYMQGGNKANVIKGYKDVEGTQPLYIAVHAIEYIYL